MSDFKTRDGILGPSGLSPADLDTSLDKKIKEQGIKPLFKTRPHIGELFSSAYYVLFEQLKHYVGKLADGMPLDQGEVASFTRMAKVLTDLSKEERAQLDQMSQEQMTTEELLDLAKQAGLLPEQ